MKYAVSQYARALADLLDGKSEKERKEIAIKFAKIAQRHRATSHLPRIFETTDRHLLKKRGLKKVIIESASRLNGHIRKEIMEVLGKNIYIEERVRASMIGGIKILIDDETLIDASAKTQIERMVTTT